MNFQTLTHLGIKENPAKIYLAALSIGSASIQELAAKANLRRPTVYEYVEELLREGLLEKVPMGKRVYFKAADPRLLEVRAKHTLQLIQKAMPELEDLRASMQGRPNISILEGEHGLKQVYEDMGKANSICFWSNLSTFERHFRDTFQKLAEGIKENGVRTREIITDTPEAKRSAKRYALTAGSNYSARLATVEGIQNDNAIYGNVVALFRLHEQNLFVVRIEDPIMAQTMKAMFEMAWKSATVFIR